MHDDLNPRERRWASTMQGFAASPPSTIDDTVTTRVAHKQPGPTVGVRAPLSRVEREEIEDMLLAPGATRAVGAGNRAREEEPDPRRTCFERDRDRIL
ncbi:MAG TPA: deoxyguanosinetriphosphate triphosphohydrolase, partial [Acidimicrobiales bacterium]